MDEDENGYVYQEDVDEEISVEGGNGLEDLMQDADLEDYDADEEDDDQIETSTEIDEKCITSFKGHEGPVFVVDVNKNGELAVSGGEDELAYVWNLITGEIILVCVGHKDSVTCACFSSDSTMVATGDMSGFIQIWKIESKSKIWKIWKFETGDLEWMQWHPVASVLLAGTQDGESWMWQVPKDNCKTFGSHGASTPVGCFMPDGKTAAVGYGDGAVKIIDLKTTEVLHNIKGKGADNGGVSSICYSADGSLIASTSIDGTAKLISASTGKVAATYNCNPQKFRSKENSEEAEENESVECSAFSPTLSLLATGCLNGFLHIWDYKSGILRHSCKHEQGVTKLQWDPAQCGGTIVYTGCLDGVCRAWDARNGQIIQSFTGSVDHIYDLKVTRAGDKLVTAYADGTVLVFKIREKENNPMT